MTEILVFPGRQALLRYRRQHTVHWGALYTWAGGHSLLEAMLAAIPSSLQPLHEMAGIMATAQALAGEGATSPLVGIAHGRRLPHKLWRLLLRLKAAGAQAGALQSSSSANLQAVGRVLEAYQLILQNNKLEDEADALARLLDYLNTHGLPSKFAHYQSLQAFDILWLRPLDIRLLLALRHHLSINLNFALPYVGNQSWLKLTHSTASILEKYHGLEINWPDAEEADEESLRSLVYTMMQDIPPEHSKLTLHRPAGLYSEVEYLLRKARQAMEQGMAAKDIVLLFPNVELYGQMAEDVAQRLSLPLAFRRSHLLSNMPMCQILLAMLRLPTVNWGVSSLIKVINNQYLFSFFQALVKEKSEADDVNYSHDAAALLELLERANYVDSYEQSLPNYLRNWLEQKPRAIHYIDLVKFLEILYEFINNLNGEKQLTSYIYTILSKIIPNLLPIMSNYDIKYERMSLDAGKLLARDMQTWQELKRSLEQLLQAGKQLNASGSNLNILQEYLGSRASQENQGSGILVMRPEDALGLRPKLLLIGGLNNNVLPLAPEPFILNEADRVFLNKTTLMPVWRGQAEDYYGQQLRLSLLLASTAQAAICTSPQADSSGQPMRASIWFNKLAAIAPVSEEHSGVFGQEPNLLQAYDYSSLRLALVYNLYGNGGQNALAKAINDKYPAIIADFAVRPQLQASDFVLAPSPKFSHYLQGIDHMSASSLNEYIICPQRWFFSYLCHLRLRRDIGLDLAIMDEGSLAHAILAEFFKPQEFMAAPSRQQAHARVDHIWQKLMVGQKQHPVILRGRKQLIIERLLRVIHNEYLTQEDYMPLAVEHGFEINLPGLPVLLGSIDRVDGAPGRLRVTDYKYSTDIRSGDFVAKTEGAHNVQLLLYLAAISREHPGQDLQARIVNGRDGGIYPPINLPSASPILDPNSEEYNIYKQIQGIWHNIQQGHFIPTSDATHCLRCNYSFICRYRELPPLGESHVREA